MRLRAVPGVLLLVHVETRRVRKPPPAPAALVRLLPGVGALVDPQGRLARKVLPTDVASEEPLVRVGRFVGFEVGGLRERPPAPLAHKGPLPRVETLVDGEVALGREGLAADEAVEGLLPRVPPLVADHMRPVAAGVGAVAALVDGLVLRHTLQVHVHEGPGGVRVVGIDEAYAATDRPKRSIVRICWENRKGRLYARTRRATPTLRLVHMLVLDCEQFLSYLRLLSTGCAPAEQVISSKKRLKKQL